MSSKSHFHWSDRSGWEREPFGQEHQEVPEPAYPHKTRQEYFGKRISPELVLHLHKMLAPDAPISAIQATADLIGISKATAYYIVRHYCRHHTPGSTVMTAPRGWKKRSADHE